MAYFGPQCHYSTFTKTSGYGDCVHNKIANFIRLVTVIIINHVNLSK